MKLRYTPRALSELDEILTYIAERSPSGAKRIQQRLQFVLNLVANYPNAGARTSNPRIRRIPTTPYPYLVYYEFDNETVTIIGLRHGARDPSSMPDEGNDSA